MHVSKNSSNSTAQFLRSKVFKSCCSRVWLPRKFCSQTRVTHTNVPLKKCSNPLRFINLTLRGQDSIPLFIGNTCNCKKSFHISIHLMQRGLFIEGAAHQHDLEAVDKPPPSPQRADCNIMKRVCVCMCVCVLVCAGFWVYSIMLRSFAKANFLQFVGSL